MKQTSIMVFMACLYLASFSCDSRSINSGDDFSPSIFLIGNSLTWDTNPRFLDGDVSWHIECGKNLPYIFENPEHPCIKSSVAWTKALKSNEYDVLVIQPFRGSTLSQDSLVISRWMRLQPNASVVIHTGWAKKTSLKDEVRCANLKSEMVDCPEYFDELIRVLEKAFPSRRITRTKALDLLIRIADDIEKRACPIDDISALYRDDIHMDMVTGRYLMHNVMRFALGQPLNSKGFGRMDPKIKLYLDDVISQLD